MTIRNGVHCYAYRCACGATASGYASESQAAQAERHHAAQAPRGHAQDTSRREIAARAVRQAIGEALIPFGHMQTAPHPRQVRDIGLSLGGIVLAEQEIHAALVEVMGA